MIIRLATCILIRHPYNFPVCLAPSIEDVAVGKMAFREPVNRGSENSPN